MSRLKAQIPPFEYVKGRVFIDMLKKAVGVERDIQLSDVFGIPRATISTWQQHDRTAHELLLRVALNNPKINIRALSLGEGELFQEEASTNEQSLRIEKLVNGRRELSEPLKRFPMSNEVLAMYALDRESTLVLEEGSELYFIDTSETHATSGSYLIDVDGHLSINLIQRLPGKKLSIVFSDTPMAVEEQDIKVLGRVAARLSKD
ncbi:helix-turn-helix domain-containing protein [Photobacterium halotolerans]|uniref:helix-turn-helix domain-containing protein n=1 Tax=Photobacterium halotolerans TaxID=265726 RepID=UPI001372F1FF|nr:helix-turn-helix domain-containing protein [Photobacterium halotolerans]NAW85657.1 transcriptional regulator [Photobacterium halotolerans]